ncbi:unnamed protein product, partial [Amoebophrya sp. A120]|eukprot:GSA120T00013052001.1
MEEIHRAVATIPAPCRSSSSRSRPLSVAQRSVLEAMLSVSRRSSPADDFAPSEAAVRAAAEECAVSRDDPQPEFKYRDPYAVENATCGICLDVWQEPVLTACCGVNFCRHCLDDWKGQQVASALSTADVEQQQAAAQGTTTDATSARERAPPDPTCPHCRSVLTDSSVHANRACARMIAHQRAVCQGC